MDEFLFTQTTPENEKGRNQCQLIPWRQESPETQVSKNRINILVSK